MSACYCTGACHNGRGCPRLSLAYFPPPTPPVGPWPPSQITVTPKPLTEDDVRRVIREEIARLKP